MRPSAFFQRAHLPPQAGVQAGRRSARKGSRRREAARKAWRGVTKRWWKAPPPSAAGASPDSRLGVWMSRRPVPKWESPRRRQGYGGLRLNWSDPSMLALPARPEISRRARPRHHEVPPAAVPASRNREAGVHKPIQPGSSCAGTALAANSTNSTHVFRRRQSPALHHAVWLSGIKLAL